MYMKKKAALPIFVGLLLVTMMVGAVSYAHWYETVRIDGVVTMGELCVKYAGGVSWKDHGNDWTIPSLQGGLTAVQINKDIATATVTYEDLVADENDYVDSVTIHIDNAYPCYYEHISFEVYNCGTIPWAIWYVELYVPDWEQTYYLQDFWTLVDLDEDGDADMELDWGDNFGDQVDPGEDVDISLEIHFLNGLEQNVDDLEFKLRIVVINWNEYDINRAIP